MRRYGILSLLLLWIIALLVWKNYQVWSGPLEVTTRKELPRRAESRAETAPPPAATEKQEAASPLMVAEKNIFSPERKEFPFPVAETPKPIVRPQVVLHGVTLAGSYQSASVVSPGRPLRKGERETMTLKIGDRVGEYKMTKILPDRITLEADQDRFEVLLFDPRSPKKRTEIRMTVAPPPSKGPLAGSPPKPSSPPPLLPPPASATPLPPGQLPRPGEPAQRVEPQPPRPAPSSPVPEPRAWRGRLPLPAIGESRRP